MSHVLRNTFLSNPEHMINLELRQKQISNNIHTKLLRLLRKD